MARSKPKGGNIATVMHNRQTFARTLPRTYPMLVTPPDFHLVSETAYRPGAEPEALRFHFRGTELLVDESGAAPWALDEVPASHDALVVGRWQGRVVVADTVAPLTAAPDGARWAGLRSLFGVMDDAQVALAGRAAQLVDWDRTHRFCGVCATPTRREASERARRCPSCNHAAYPRISPAMMCLVTRGREMLLARNVNFPPGRYSALAGFLEAGESIEEAISREVMEEVGITVKDPVYYGSQSWPFPHSLMIAFTAEYDAGDLRPNGHEIAEAAWFRCDALPQLPPRVSIARALVDHAIARLSS
jgi:NAD+ diphosphatase